MSFYSLTTLPNGLRIITEQMAGIRSAAIGCWVDTGTRDERPNEDGASHFLEHLLFKGSERLSARHISETLDSVGAQYNAFTSKEYTCYWTRLLDEDMAMGLDILGEMLQRPAFREGEIDSERNVVIEEINMNEDEPDDVLFETFSQLMYEGHDLARPILGARGSILEMSRDDIDGYWSRRYNAGSVVVAVVSSLPHEEVVEEVVTRFGDWHAGEVDHVLAPLVLTSGARAVNKETEQAHLIVGGELFPRGDDDRWAFEILNHVLGSGMSSRLFRSIREERGLAYSVYLFGSPAADVGSWGVYAGTSPIHLDEVLTLINHELDLVMEHGITEEELKRAKGGVRGAVALSMEDANSRMMRLGRQLLTGAELLSTGERMERVDAVTCKDVLMVARKVFSGPRVIAGVGPFETADLEKYLP